jgi:hypothetical protein
MLALLVFISSSGLVLNKHYCMNELKNIAIFFKAKSCHEESIMANCSMHKHLVSHEKKDCCNDETEYIKSDIDQMQTTADVLSFQQIVQPGMALLLSNEDSSSFYKQLIHYLNYKPPLLACNVLVRFQAFLL